MASTLEIQSRIKTLQKLEKKHALSNKFKQFSTVNILRREWQQKINS